MSEEMETMKPAHLQAEIRAMTVSAPASFMSLKHILVPHNTSRSYKQSIDVLKNKCMIVTSNALVYVR